MTFENPTVLGIDTSGSIASCAVMRSDQLVAETTFVTKLTHSQVILPVMKRTLSDCGLKLSDIDLFAVAAGPGSYTGLRIGIAAVKGLCALGKPCIGVSTLESMAQGCAVFKGRIIPVMAARKGIAYVGCYDSDGERITKVFEDKVVNESEIAAFADFDGSVLLTGDCSQRLKDELFQNSARVTAAPARLRNQSAAGVCLAALCHLDEAGEAEKLDAMYLQITKAEKDLKEKKEV